MEIKTYLLDTFRYNDFANKRVLEKIKTLPDQKESIRFFSHLINSQNKWMVRITKDKKAIPMSWWDPVYLINDIENLWTVSLQSWLTFIENKNEKELVEEIRFTGMDGGQWVSTIKDIALQLNYHSIHHRAQLQTIIRQQGLTPDFVDYIGTKYRKLS